MHSKYEAVLFMEVNAPCDCTLRSHWWTEPVMQLESGVPCFCVPKGERVQCAVLLHSTADHLRCLELLTQQLTNDHVTVLEGGLGFVNTETGEFIRSNWDLGETEEWELVTEAALKHNRVLHTFSATDLAMEVTIQDSVVTIQLLDWEAPGGIESSRLSEPTHVFVGVEEFMNKVRARLADLKFLQRAARRHYPASENLVQLLSVKERRG